jgi:hypothetical protein
MQDAQVPTDPEDGASDQPRRAGIRLRDTEAVATARRDMFGDGSLLDTLAGPPPAPENAEGPAADPAAPAQPAAPSQPEAAEGQVADPAQHAAPAEAASAEAPEPALGPADAAQSLDAIIDSFPAERPGGGDEADAAGPSPGAPPVAVTPSMGIASLFDSLGGVGPPVDDASPVEEPPPPGAPALELDMSMLEIRVPARPTLFPESDAPTLAAPADVPPLPVGPDSQPHEVQAHEVQADVSHADLARADLARADEGQAGEPQADGPDLDMSMLERSPARPVLQAESDPYELYGGYALPAEGEVQPDRVPTYDAAAEPDAPASDAGWVAPPPFPERPDEVAGGGPYSELPVLLDLVEPRKAVSPPPFIEPLVLPGLAEAAEPETAPGYDPGYEEPMAAPAFRGHSEPADARGAPEPLVMPGYSEPDESAARPMFDAAYKIEAEAQATADALDNLKRMLGHTDPGQQEPIGPAAGQGHMRLNLHGDPTAFPSPPTMMPMPMPEPPERRRTSSIYLLGFLTGLGLSLMAGIALYVLINVM